MIIRSSINQLLYAGFYPDVEDLCLGKDVTNLESELAQVKAENEKLREVLYEEWLSHKLDTVEEYYNMPQVQAKEIFNKMLKQKLEE